MSDPPGSFRVRGVPGGWRDWWNQPDDSVQLRARAEVADRRQMVRAELLGRLWHDEIGEEAPARPGLSGGPALPGQC